MSDMQTLTRNFISTKCWGEVLRKMPVPCVDTIIHHEDRILLGWRIIPPYRNVWALVGGRILYGESFEDTSIRNCRQSRIKVHRPKYVGLFPVKLPQRHDIVICMSARYITGEPKPTGEISKYTWIRKIDLHKIQPIGANYTKMLRTYWKPERTKRTT